MVSKVSACCGGGGWGVEGGMSKRNFSNLQHSLFFFFFKDFIYLFDREREITSRQRDRQRERGKQASR